MEFFFAGIFALAVACGPASAALLSVQGVARDPASGRLLYREDHLIKRSGSVRIARVLLYRCPDGQAFARKRVDYSPSDIAPSFSLIDARDGYREGLKRDGDGAEVCSSTKSEPLPQASGTLVADAGFKQFLRGHWDALLAKRSLSIDFVMPSFGRSLGFEVESTGSCAIAGDAVQPFRLKLRDLLGMVAPDIDLPTTLPATAACAVSPEYAISATTAATTSPRASISPGRVRPLTRRCGRRRSRRDWTPAQSAADQSRLCVPAAMGTLAIP